MGNLFSQPRTTWVQDTVHVLRSSSARSFHKLTNAKIHLHVHSQADLSRYLHVSVHTRDGVVQTGSGKRQGWVSLGSPTS